MPRLSKRSSPKDIQEAYESGLIGSRRDPDGLDRLLGELPHPLFGAASTKKVGRKIITLDGSGKGKVSLLYLSREKYDPGAFEEEKQDTGDCVAQGTRNATDTTRSVEIHINKEPEGYVARGSVEAIYGCRGHGGQGMSCSEAARFVHKSGGILLRRDYPDLGIDLSEYTSSIGTKWGRSGVPDAVTREAIKHQVKTISLVTSVEEARDAIANGYALCVCSNYGFSNTRDKEGFARPKGNWSHAMAWLGCDDDYKRPGILVQNSWGRWNVGPKRHNQPEGSFWIDMEVADKMLRQRGAWVFSNVDGFPPKTLPDYSTGVL